MYHAIAQLVIFPIGSLVICRVWEWALTPILRPVLVRVRNRITGRWAAFTVDASHPDRPIIL